MKSVLAAILCFALVVSATAQQTPPQQARTLSKEARKVEQKARSLAPGAPISVVRRGADEEFGEFRSVQDDSFTFFDVDSKLEMQLRFEDVRKVKDGYGGYNNFTHRHVDRTRSRIAVACVLGGLAVVLGVALARDKS